MQLYFPYPANFYFPHDPPFPRNIGYYYLVFFSFSHKLKNEKLKENNTKTLHQNVQLEVLIMIFSGQESLK